MKGNIHSIESMGLVDGPGIRTVVFFQGCSLRCRFCHNPDTWQLSGREQIEASQLLRRLLRYKPYFDRSGGGVTFSGGEPLLQPAFLLEMLTLCQAAGVHTCVDTAGCGKGDYDAILAHTDLLLYDVKEISAQRYRSMTGRDWEETRHFLQAVRKAGTPVWVRHVVIPGLTDGEAHIRALKAFIGQEVPNVQRVELLPYHTLGVHKYQSLGLPYSLEGVPPMDPALCASWQKQYFP